MKKTSIAIATLALVLAFGCKNQSTTTAAANNNPTSVSQNNNLTPEQLGELGAKIKKNPDEAKKLLTEQGLTEESFEKQIRLVAQDPDASKRYAAAYKKASA